MRLARAFIFALAALLPASALADDFGPHRDIGQVTSAAKHLLAYRLRSANIAPESAVISDVVVVKDQAILTWQAGTNEGLMGLIRYADRWWNAFDERPPAAASVPVMNECTPARASFPLRKPDPGTAGLQAFGFTNDLAAAASAHNTLWRRISTIRPTTYWDVSQLWFVCPLVTAAVPHAQPFSNLHSVFSGQGDGYNFTLLYAPTDAPPGAKASLRVRAPSLSEMLDPSSPPANYGYSTGVLFFYLDVATSKPIAFQPGSTVDVWVPWVLDDSLRYEFQMIEGKTMVGTVKGTVHDNVLHFVLPAFTAADGEFIGEVDGYY